MARMYAFLILAASAIGAEADCTVPVLGSTDFTYTPTTCVAGGAVAQGAECTIVATGYTCKSPGVCGTDDKFAETDPGCLKWCTVPTIADGVGSWSTGCEAGTEVAQQTECTITPAVGYTCTSPGKCGAEGKFAAVGACTLKPTTVTTTLTPWDSSASSGSDVTSLESSYSSSFKRDSSGDSSGSGNSSGSTASGSSGSYMQLWQWLLLAALCCCLAGAGGAAAMGSKKPKKKKPTPKPVPAPEPQMVVEPLMPQLMPLATTSMAVPQYAYAQAAPQYAYAAAPQYAGYPGTVV